MQKLFKITTDYADQTDMKINANKSAYSTIFTNNTFKPKINSTVIPFLREQQYYKYLGVEISLSLDWSKSIVDSMSKYRKAIHNICKKYTYQQHKK